MEEVSQQYKEVFNSGYLLAKHEPELTAQFFKSANEYSDYFKGLNSGSQEYEKEKNKQKLNEAPNNKNVSKESRDIERGK